MRDEARILLLMPYFGPWPEWVEFYLASCRWNRSVHWLFFGDHGPPGELTPNLGYRELSLAEFHALAEERLECSLDLRDAYKVCDLRLAFARIFAEHLGGYDFFGWGDIDVVFGNLRKHLTSEVLRHDVVTFNEKHLSGHFTLVRNSDRACGLHLALPEYLEHVTDSEYHHLDEPHPRRLEGFEVYARESFNTPLSRLIPWRDGRFIFPSEWRWKDGSLTNDLDGDREFLYLHFMHWKGGAWPRKCGNAQWERLSQIVHLDPRMADRGFRVNATGFHPL